MLKVILETAGGGDDDVKAVAQGVALRTVADAAEDGADAEVGEPGEVAHGGFDLHGEFAGGFKHEAAEASVRTEFLQRGERERGGFAGPGLGGSNNVAAFESRRDRPELDWGGIPVTHRLDAFEKWLGQSKLGERHVKGGQSGRRGDLSTCA